MSERFATYSVAILVAGLLAAVVVKVYGHAAVYRIVGIIAAVGAPVVAWFFAVHTLG